MNVKAIIDVDDPRSWPREIEEAVRNKAEVLRNTTRYFGDLDVPIEEEDPFRELTRGYLVRAYHATRLLDNEAENIRLRGLKPLTQELIESRIREAVERNFVDRAVGEALLSGNALKSRSREKRAGQVCLFLSEVGLREDVDEIWPLMTIWGGEGINFTVAGNDHRDQLSIGTPAIVVALLDLSSGWRTHLVSPGLKHLFVGKSLGFDESGQGFGSSVHNRAAVPPECIEAIWQPGNPEYEGYPDLPDA